MYKCELINENGSFDIETGFETVKDAFEWATGRGTHYNALVEDEETEELWKFPILSSKKDMFAKISARNGDIYAIDMIGIILVRLAYQKDVEEDVK